MKSILLKLGLSFFALSIFSTQIQAQDEFEYVEVLDHPRYTLNDRLSFDAGFSFLPLDAYHKPMMFELAASYQFSDWIAIEIARFGYTIFNHDTGLNASVAQQIDPNNPNLENVSGQELEDLRFRAGSAAFLNLLYSKSNWFNTSIVYHYWQAGLGFSYWDMDKTSQTTADLLIRVRFFINNNFMFNFRVGHSIGFKSSAPKNISLIGLGGGFAL